MSEKTTPTAPVAAAEPLTVDTVASQHPDIAAVLMEQGAVAERARIAAIFQHDHAEGRQKLAEHLAFKTDLSVEDAAGMLAASPRQVLDTVSGKSPFETAMAAIDDPDIGAGGEPGGEMTPQTMAKSVVEMARQAGVIQ